MRTSKPPPKRPKKILYNPPVIILNETSFESFAYCWHYGNRNECTTTLIQFCRSTSSICSDYAPEYTRAAEMALPLKTPNILRMGFVDCVDSPELCDKYGYDKIPLLLQFELDGNAGDPGRKRRSYTKAELILEEAVVALNIEYRKRLGYSAYAGWPKFSLLEDVNNATDVWDFFDKCDTQAIIVPVVDKDEPLGMLRFITAYNKAQVQGKFPVARVSQNHTLVEIQKSPIPDMFMIKRDVKDAVNCPNPPANITKFPDYNQFLESFFGTGKESKIVEDQSFPNEKMIIYRERK
ncbi:hypothetical protein M3Y97_00302900 [Aphelenchoides bicaudatus]|nr:hypothetical protein M3Y97_00302900 [Aphelenchoides bicaudatus]